MYLWLWERDLGIEKINQLDAHKTLILAAHTIQIIIKITASFILFILSLALKY